MKSRANLTRIYFGIQEPIDNTACLEFQQQSNDDMKSLGGAAMFNNFFTNRTSSNKNLDSKNTANAPRINFDPKGAARLNAATSIALQQQSGR
jgi:heat shock protein HslJ